MIQIALAMLTHDQHNTSRLWSASPSQVLYQSVVGDLLFYQVANTNGPVCVGQQVDVCMDGAQPSLVEALVPAHSGHSAH